MKYEVIATMGVVGPEGKGLTLYFQDMQLGALITKRNNELLLEKKGRGTRGIYYSGYSKYTVSTGNGTYFVGSRTH